MQLRSIKFASEKDFLRHSRKFFNLIIKYLVSRQAENNKQESAFDIIELNFKDK